MENILDESKTRLVESAMKSIANEHLRLMELIPYGEWAALIPVITQAKRIFIMGAGRTGLMMKAAAMRFMHLGYEVHVVGETTSPAIGAGDVLIAGSGSGTTLGIVNAAETTKQVGAGLICFTTNPDSRLALLSDHVVRIPAAEKQGRDESISKQYAGSLFEQSLLLGLDALFQTLWELDGSPASELWKRHANME
ncbi:6-phospho-3-hexuloisomerase [Zobellia galactanivorans]|uniref:6-phospho-3-hexuloisomerase n=1 Tax=Zobellia galactanivorans (strain DSM 12802 / CCUG 47099 / CIP 106680 / NCIMB 13871 / Dsij) TaxID=63186 RepID=UPI0026E24B42|nr:6-phospho-3-hexuloisomerase [Zobellia galactanivorans]MDO6807662.1 6-phospho-3-hexuloisomerase [Zobellia galactanivorans]